MAFPSVPTRFTRTGFLAGATLAIALLSGCAGLSSETVVERVDAATSTTSTSDTATPVADPATDASADATVSTASTNAPIVTTDATQNETGSAPANAESDGASTESGVDSDDAPAATTADSEVDDHSPSAAADPVTAEPADAGDGDAEATDSASFDVQSADCMEGKWIAQPGELELLMHTIGLHTGVEMHSSGQLIVVLEAGHYIIDSSITTRITIDGIDTVSVTEGITQGDYYYDNGFIATTQTFADVSGYLEVLGTRVDTAELGATLNDSFNSTEVPYDCGDNPVLWFETIPGAPRHDVVFQPFNG